MDDRTYIVGMRQDGKTAMAQQMAAEAQAELSDVYLYYLSTDGGQSWRGATMAEYVAAERANGFNAPAGVPATISWRNGRNEGRQGFLMDASEPG